MKVFNLAYANIKENKGAAVSLLILILIAALLLNIGLTIMTQIYTFYDNKVAELEDAHVNIITRSPEYSAMYEDYFRSYNGISRTETQEALLLEGANLRYGDNEMTMKAVVLNADAGNIISPLKLTEKLEPAGGNDIFMSYSFLSSGGYNLGDTFVLSYSDRDYTFRVAGFFETTMFGTTNMGVLKFLMPNQTYLQLAEEVGEEAVAIQLSTVLEDSAQTSRLFNDFVMKFSENVADGGFPYLSMDIHTAKSAGTITVNVVAMIIVAFAAVIVLVSLIVIIFRVTNSIEDGMVNIGVLKAVGYTSWPILVSIVLQYMLITLLGGAAGVAISYLAMPLFGGIIASLSGLVWSGSFDLAINMISILIVAALVLSITAFIALRIRKLHPVSALRGGIMTHSFRKNRFSLEKAEGRGLHFLLACKTMLANSKQNITIAIIMAAVTFASVFAIVLYYNIASDKSAFIHLVGVETSDVLVLAKPDADALELRSGMEHMEGVVNVSLLDLISTELEGYTYTTNVSDDYGKLNNNTVYEGRYPIHDNEIAISWLISNQLGKRIGDTVKVEFGNTSGSYLITGLSQSINNMGLEANMTAAGVQKLFPEYAGKMFNVYLEGVDNASFIASLQAQYGALVAEIIDVAETVESQTSIYTTVVFVVMVMILTITSLVVALILYLVIRMMILKRKKEFGILTANGFTSFQLMNQITLSFVPIVAIGVAIGCLLGYLYTNSLLALLLSSAGIRNVQFMVDLPMTIALSAGIVILAYVVSMLVARRIKRISAYELITE